MRLGLLAYGLSPREVLEAARLAEDFGHDSLWLVEDHWDAGPIPLAAACASMTQQLEIGIGVMNPFTRHPCALAMDYLALCEISGGRVVVGIGAGAERWIEQMGLAYRYPRTAVRETILLLRQLMQGETVSFHGTVFHTSDIRLNRVPDRVPPIYMGAMGQKSVETCGEVADGWIVSLLQPLAFVKAARKRLLAGAKTAGRPDQAPDIIQYVPFSCGKKRSTARAKAKILLAEELKAEIELYRDQHVVLASFSNHLESMSPDEYSHVISELARGVDPADAIPADLLDELTIAGTPDDCMERIVSYQDAGVTALAFLCHGETLRETAKIIGGLCTK